VVFQLRPNLHLDLRALRWALTAFPGDARVAVEFRPPSWFVPATRSLLESRGRGVLRDRCRWSSRPLVGDGVVGICPIHHGRARPDSCYGRAALQTWARRVADLWPGTGDVFVYFNNDLRRCAPRDTHRFALAVDRLGLAATGIRTARECTAGLKQFHGLAPLIPGITPL
jgi:uncharacterized protein YecE (DUF72 family)